MKNVSVFEVSHNKSFGLYNVFLNMAYADAEDAADVWAWCVESFCDNKSFLRQLSELVDSSLFMPKEFNYAVTERLCNNSKLFFLLYNNGMIGCKALSEIISRAIELGRCKEARLFFKTLFCDKNISDEKKFSLLSHLLMMCRKKKSIVYLKQFISSIYSLIVININSYDELSIELENSIDIIYRMLS